MVVNLIPSFGSFGSKLISPIVLRTSPANDDPPDWELYDGTPAKLTEEYPYCNEDILFPPPFELVKKDAKVFEDFLSSVKSLKVPSPIYDEFAAQNIVMKDEKRYSLGPAGERMLLRSNWTPNEITAVGGRFVNIHGATFYIDAEGGRTGRLHWLNNGTVYTYVGLQEGVAFLENTNVLDQDAVNELMARVQKAIIEAGKKPFVPAGRVRRRLGREIMFV